MRTPKESAILVEEVVSKINQLKKNVTNLEEEMEIITNVCKKYKINREHILSVVCFWERYDNQLNLKL